MGIQIEKNVPPPSLSEEYSKYPFKQMEVGDSFALGFGGINLQNSVRSKLSSAAANYQRKHTQKKFTVRIDREKGEVRVWRTE